MGNPNAWAKDSCDPQFTTFSHPCRGTLDTCQGPETLNMPNWKLGENNEKKPVATSCWRYAFRFHMEECKKNEGFMIQPEERSGFGNGQLIETDMAKQAGIKVFRTWTNYGDFENNKIQKRATGSRTGIRAAV